MAANSGTQSRHQRFDELMQAGAQALEAGDRRAAHDHWREAATIDPYSEQVWLSLLRVLDDEEDRHVCLENIIAINPLNVQARRLLHRQSPDTSNPAIPVVTPAQASEAATRPQRPDGARPKPKTQKTATQSRSAVNSKQKQTRKQQGRQTRPRRSIGSLLGLVIGALVIAILIGLLISVVVFGRH